MVEKKKQLNYGLYDAVVVQKINAEWERFTSDLMNDGYARLNKKQFQVDFTELVGPAVRKWVMTGLSKGESKREATREVVRERMVEDINAKVKEHLTEILKIIEPVVDKFLEDYYGSRPPES